MNVTEYGVIGDGISDDTAALQQLINTHKGDLCFPPGTYKISQLVTHGDIHLVGAGALCATIKTISPAGDVITVEGVDNQIRDLGFDSFVPRTGGSYVNFGPISSFGFLDRFHMRGPFIGVSVSGPVSHYIDRGAIYGTKYCGIKVCGGQDHYISHITMNNEPDRQSSFGFVITQTGNTNINDCDIIHCGTDLFIDGGFSIYVRDSFFDTAFCGIAIGASSPVERCHFHGCWTSSHTGHGVLIDPNGIGQVRTIEFIGHHSLFNQADGIHLGRGQDIKLVGGSFDDNVMSGVAVGATNTIVSSNSISRNGYGLYFLPAATGTVMSGNCIRDNVYADVVGAP